LAVLITAMHRTEQRRLPVVLVGAELPQLRGQMGNAKSYAERLFDFPAVGALPPDPAGPTAVIAPSHAGFARRVAGQADSQIGLFQRIASSLHRAAKPARSTRLSPTPSAETPSSSAGASPLLTQKVG
jgi:hypothetical protein